MLVSDPDTRIKLEQLPHYSSNSSSDMMAAASILVLPLINKSDDISSLLAQCFAIVPFAIHYPHLLVPFHYAFKEERAPQLFLLRVPRRRLVARLPIQMRSGDNNTVSECFGRLLPLESSGGDGDGVCPEHPFFADKEASSLKPKRQDK